MLSPSLLSWLRLSLVALAAAALSSACSSDRPATSAVLGGGTPKPVGAPCETGDTQPCSITLSQNKGVLECYHGTQQCTDGRWSECGDGQLSEQAALAAPPGLLPVALSSPAACVNNPCNPFCRWFEEVPDAPLTAVQGDGSGFQWETGSLADLPGDVVQTGLNQPCETGRDCQFNTRCEDPSPGTCTHGVCETGVALTAGCSQCVELVHQVAEQYPDAYGHCFGMPPDPSAEECLHDPCSAGSALKQNCQAEVAQLCLEPELAYCCSDAWDGACVQRYRTLNPNACQCALGEVARGNGCYYYHEGALPWQSALETCRARGEGWDLARIDDANEDGFLFNTFGGDPGDPPAEQGLWIGLSDIWAEGSWRWSSEDDFEVWNESSASANDYVHWCGLDGSTASCPAATAAPLPGAYACASVSQSGDWHSELCGQAYPSVCEGPPLTSGSIEGEACDSQGQYFPSRTYVSSNLPIDHGFEVGEYVITIVARATYGGGAWADLALSIDDQLIDRVTINDADWKSYTFEYSASAAGQATINIAFPNDYFGGSGDDRNLYVNQVSVSCASSGSAVPAWGDECAGLAETVCDVSCNAEVSETGSCVPWLPGETDPSCPDRPDLALGVPCDSAIPVCNHGQVEAAPGVNVLHFPESAGQFGSPSPDTSAAGVVTCQTSVAIPAGQCITLSDTDCVDQSGDPAPLAGTRHLMVNPPGAGAISECSNLDNWSVHVDSVSCGEPACFGGSTAATSVRRPVDIVVVIDNSASMEEEIFQVEQRINQDFADIIGESGLDYRVIMVSRYGDLDTPFGSGGGGTSYPICIAEPLGSHDCSDPNNQVPLPAERFFHYSARVGSLDAPCLLLDGFSAPDELAVQDRPGWQVQAPTGYGAWLRPDAFKVFVVITDDNVECRTAGGQWFDDGETVAGGNSVADSFDTALRALSTSQFENEQGERDYVWHSIVNIQENTPADQPWPPDAPMTTTQCSGPAGSYVGPGTGYQALSRLTGGLRYPSCRTSDFDAVFNAIAQDVIEQSAASCTFEAAGTGVDWEAPRVSYTSGSDVRIDLEQVTDATGCASGGWYLEPSADAEAAMVSLCPDTCSEVQADPGAQLFVEFACEAPLVNTTHTEIYEADCEAGSIVEWKAVGYDTTIEALGSVEFQVRTANTLAELEDASYQPLNVATQSAPDCLYLEPMTCVEEDTECDCVSSEGMPGGIGAGVLLSGGRLDLVESRHQYLELSITVVPDLGGMTSPTVETWKVAYSCLPGE